MGKSKRCAYGNCRSDSRYLKDNSIFFIPFPKPKRNLSKCLNWIERCGRLDDFGVESIKDYTYVCSLHFVGGKGPTQENTDLLDFRETQEYKDFKERWYGETCHIPFDPPTSIPSTSVTVETLIAIKEECPSPTGSRETLSAISDLEELVERSEDEEILGNSEVNQLSMINEVEEVTVKIEVNESSTIHKDESLEQPAVTYQLVSFQQVPNAPSTSTSTFVSFLNELPSVLPQKWAVSYNEELKEVKFLKTGLDDTSVVISIKITLPSEEEPEQCLEMKVLNHVISIKHRAASLLNQYLSDCWRARISDVRYAIGVVEDFNVCLGVGALELVEEFQSSSRQINGFYCWQDNALHSHKCEFLIIQFNAACKECTKIKVALRKRIYRRKIRKKSLLDDLSANDSDL